MRVSSIKAKMLAVFALQALALAALAMMAIRSVGILNDDISELYQQRLVPVSQLAKISDLMHVCIEQLTIAVIARPSPQNVQKYIDRVEANLAEIDTLVKNYSATVIADDNRKMLQEDEMLREWVAERDELVGKAIRPAIIALKTQAFNDAEDFVLGVGIKQFGKVQQLFNIIITGALKSAESTRLAANASFGQMRYLMMASVLLALGMSCLLAVYFSRSVTGPLNAMTSAMKRLASGDLSIAVPEIGRGDEIGLMAEAVSIFKEDIIGARRLETEQKAERLRKEQRQAAIEQLLASFERRVIASLDDLAVAANTMRGTSQGMSANVEVTSAQTAAVASAAKQASANVEAVAATTEEMATSVSQIGRQVQDSARIAGTAVEQARKTDGRIHALTEAASRIGDVVNLITSIAKQTNLLALNATIEAARAGEAGRGFAVVAQEVKQLASQTAKATSEIGNQIGCIQTATEDSVEAIKEIGATIAHISKIASAVAAAVEQQGAATQEIARNVHQAAHGTEHVSANIVGVNQAAAKTGLAAGQVLKAAETLGIQADSLRADVDRFLADIRAA